MLSKMKINSLLKKLKAINDKKEQGKATDKEQECKLLMQLAELYETLKFDKNYPQAAVFSREYYRSAGVLGSAEAQYRYAMLRMEEAKFWDEFANGAYGREIHRTYAKNNFEEAFNYLNEAIDNNHILAKRQYGLAYIKGWGLEPDREKGIEMIVESIKAEGAWDNAAEIINNLGLDSSKFFESIMAFQHKKD